MPSLECGLEMHERHQMDMFCYYYYLSIEQLLLHPEIIKFSWQPRAPPAKKRSNNADAYAGEGE
jgi:hypothetical protein